MTLTIETDKTYNGWTDYETWNAALWINNEETLYNLAKACRDYNEFLFEMQTMCGFFETPDGVRWADADLTEMDELIEEL